MMVKSNTSDRSRLTSTNWSASIVSFHLWSLQVVTLFLIIAHLGLPVSGNSHELLDEVALIEGNNEPSDEPSTQLLDEVKRSWQSLQGSWGKRDHSEPYALNMVPEIGEYDAQASEWKPNGMTGGFGDHPEMMKYSVIYASSPNALAAAVAAAASGLTNNGDATNEESDTPGYEKKSWKNMSVAWGKRRSAVWNKFRGSWGKREPGWNNLKGMWGKRSSGDWKKLQSAWGKRTLQN